MLNDVDVDLHVAVVDGVVTDDVVAVDGDVAADDVVEHYQNVFHQYHYLDSVSLVGHYGHYLMVHLSLDSRPYVAGVED